MLQYIQKCKNLQWYEVLFKYETVILTKKINQAFHPTGLDSPILPPGWKLNTMTLKNKWTTLWPQTGLVVY